MQSTVSISPVRPGLELLRVEHAYLFHRPSSATDKDTAAVAGRRILVLRSRS